MSEKFKEVSASIEISRRRGNGLDGVVNIMRDLVERRNAAFSELVYDMAFPDSPEATARREALEASEAAERAKRDAQLVGAPPCPFCGGVPRWFEGDECGWAVECADCGATTPDAETWNDRTSHPR